MLYKVSTAGRHYKEGPHTRRLEKVGFKFKELDGVYIEFGKRLGYDCELVEKEITKEMTDDDVIKLSTKFAIILHHNEIKIYDGYIE